ncbi:MAG: hypothetical protein JSV92_03975 [archaeon]|nr:MAG: hypothetical protein JSV92_03975 [archaeon]
MKNIIGDIHAVRAEEEKEEDKDTQAQEEKEEDASQEKIKNMFKSYFS